MVQLHLLGMSFIMTLTYLLSFIVIYAHYVLNHRFDCIVDHASSWWLSFWNQEDFKIMVQKLFELYVGLCTTCTVDFELFSLFLPPFSYHTYGHIAYLGSSSICVIPLCTSQLTSARRSLCEICVARAIDLKGSNLLSQ